MNVKIPKSLGIQSLKQNYYFLGLIFSLVLVLNEAVAVMPIRVTDDKIRCCPNDRILDPRINLRGYDCPCALPGLSSNNDESENKKPVQIEKSCPENQLSIAEQSTVAPSLFGYAIQTPHGYFCEFTNSAGPLDGGCKCGTITQGMECACSGPICIFGNQKNE